MKLTATVHRVVSLALLACLAGCAGGGISSDGGPIGTGITASVAGNVVAVVASSDATQATALDLPAVTVSIDEVGVETSTDAEGNFSLDGDFAGALTVRFRSGDVEGTQQVDVPTGALVVLADVVVAAGQVDAEAGRQVGFLARVLRTDCAASELVVEDDRKEPRQFLVRLVDDTRFVRRDGSDASCGDVAQRAQIAIDGVFAPDSGTGSTVTALSITLGAERGTRPDVVDDVPFAGIVAQVRCAAGTLTVADAEQRTRVRLDAETTIRDRSGATLTCADVGVGDRVAGLGRLRVKQAGAIDATTLVVGMGATSADVRLSGEVVGKDCTQDVLQLDDGDAVAAVRIGPQTVVDPVLSCDQIPLGARVRGLGRVQSDDPDVLLAVRLAVRRPAR
ncbi:hypothetical protein K2Z84_27660 [Candidatus Binatia bacterium]|jgi:hypothetical protein|nr:hypothetical protein [Candidatus Binatia bacterium]